MAPETVNNQRYYIAMIELRLCSQAFLVLDARPILGSMLLVVHVTEKGYKIWYIIRGRCAEPLMWAVFRL